jgi:hypothetical protein
MSSSLDKRIELALVAPVGSDGPEPHIDSRHPSSSEPGGSPESPSAPVPEPPVAVRRSPFRAPVRRPTRRTFVAGQTRNEWSA